MFSGMVPSPGFQSRFFVLANENRTQDAGHALLRQGRNPKVRKNSGVIRVWLQKRHGKEKRFRIYTGHLTTTQERERLWPLDRQVAAAYRQLRPYCDSLPDGQVQSLDDGFNAGEPYYSLSWLIADILENNIAVPQRRLA